MATPSLVRDSLFQLNVVLWASLPQPVDAPITPVIRNLGYSLWSIEQPLEAGLPMLARLKDTELDVGTNPTPDVVLRHEDTDTFVLIECKPSSFGLGSGRAPQALGLLVAGTDLGSRLGMSGTPLGELCYVVPGEDAARIDSTLTTLAQELTSRGLSACPSGPLGISIKADGTYLGLPTEPNGRAQLPRALTPEQNVIKSQPGEEPRPLYIVPGHRMPPTVQTWQS